MPKMFILWLIEAKNICLCLTSARCLLAEGGLCEGNRGHAIRMIIVLNDLSEHRLFL